MLKNYFKIAFRSFRKRKSYTLITITGLSFGITCCLLIFIYIKQELSYDKFHTNAGRIYRMAIETNRSGGTDYRANTCLPAATAFKEDYPEVENITRIWVRDTTLVRSENKRFLEERFIHVDSDMFKIFSFHLLSGNSEKILDDPTSVVITESMAKKYFDKKNPVGRLLHVGQEQEFRVSGVMKDVPMNSHFHFDFVASFIISLLTVSYQAFKAATADPVKSL